MLAYMLDALQPLPLIASFAGVMLGIVFGILPGLTATMGIAILVPLTFGVAPNIAFSALLGVYVGSIYAGSITAILISTPGTPAAAATLLEGPAMAKKGQAGKALSITTWSSFFGGIFSCVALVFIAPQLAKFALSFGPPEYFAVAFFGLTVVAMLSSESLLKGLIAALLGMWLATIGIDPVVGSIRNTLDIGQLLGGVSMTAALVGLFAIPQVVEKMEEAWQKRVSGQDDNSLQTKIGAKEKVDFLNIIKKLPNLLRSSTIGTIIGIIPATGSGTASYVSYNECKRFAKNKDDFGKGCEEGLVATETANNAVTGGALVPLLTLGIPGDVVTAVILGALLIQGVTPGPMLFATSPEIVGGIFGSLILANIFMLLMGLWAAKHFIKIIRIPPYVIAPVIVVLCVIGVYGINNSIFDIYVMLFFGVLGFLLNKMKFPLAPLLLGLILSPLIEENFRKSMLMSQGDFSIFFDKNISLVMLLISFIVLVSVAYKATKKWLIEVIK